jgi:tape measure domain-containing protein
MELFKLYGTVEIDEKKVNSQLSSINSKAKDTGGILGNIGKSFVTGFSAMGGAKLFETIASGLTNGAKAGWAFNNSMEQNLVKFKVFLKDADQAKKLMDDLNVMAKKTPFELKDLSEGATKLLNYGISLDKVRGNLMQLGDIAMGNAEKMQGLATAFGQVKGNGRLMGEELNQMIERGFNPLDYISRRTGESMADLRGRMSDGLVTFAEVEQALTDATTGTGAFSGSMDEMSKTFEGQMSTLRDNTAQTFGQILQPLFNYMSTTVLPLLNSRMEGTGQKVAEVMSTIGSFITTYAIPALSSLADSIYKVYSYGQQYIPVFRETATISFNMVADTARGLAPPLEDFANRVIPTVANQVNWFSTVVMPKFNSALEYTRTSILPQFVNSFSTWLPQIANTFDNTWVIVRNGLSGLLGAFSWIMPMIKYNVQSAVNEINRQISSVINIFDGLMGFIRNVFSGNWGSAWKSIVQLTSGVLAQLPMVVRSPLNAMIGVVNSALSRIGKMSFSLPGFMGGGKVGISVGMIPYLADGGNITSGGMAIVGEKGAELINLPKGASVTPLNKTNSGIVVNINNPTLLNRDAIDEIMNIVTRRLKAEGAY